MMNKKKHHDEETAAAAVPAQGGAEDAAAAEDRETTEQFEQFVREAERAARERDEYLSLAQRVQADFDNYRRRNQNVREDAYNEGIRDTLSKFLPVLDNLERAAAAQGDGASLREGVLLVLKQLCGVFTAAGVEEIPAQDCCFDPNVHHAVMQEPVEGCESGKVVTVLQKGYTHGGRVLRHCMVKVAE